MRAGRSFRRLTSIGALALLSTVWTLGAILPAANAPPETRVAAKPLGGGAIYFVENRGQVPGGATFYTEGSDLFLGLGPAGASLTLYGPPPGARAEGPRRPGLELRGVEEHVDPLTGEMTWVPDPKAPPPPEQARHTLRLDFVGASTAVRPVGRQRLPTVVSYFRGGRDEWHTGLATYREVVYPDLWPGADLVFSREADQVKYLFKLRPGADPGAIRLAWRGASAVTVDVSGAMKVANPVRDLRDSAPRVYQMVNGRRVPITAGYALDSGAAGSDQQFGFRLGAYDHERELIIDPAFLAYAGLFGRPLGDRGLGIAVDGAGSAYFCGQSTSAQGDDDAYAVKVSSDGTHYVYVAFLGGAKHDTCFDIGVDPAGSAYLTGVAGSSAATGFPVTVGPDLTHNGGGDDTLVAKLDPSGTSLVYAGFLGSAGFDFGEGIRVAPDGSAYLSGIAGGAFSFPLTVGPDLTFNGSYDAYICKLKPVPSAAIPKNNYDYCGYVGGAKDDIGHFKDLDGSFSLTAGHVAIDDLGQAYLSGMTQSDETTFPDGDGFGDLPGPDRTHNGDWDAWVAKVKSDGSGLVYAGYLGGRGQDEGYGAGVDEAGNFYFAGSTMSREDFPAVVGPDLSYNGGDSDGFVAKVAADGSHYAYAGYIGDDGVLDNNGQTDEMAVGLTVDAQGHAYPIGWTYDAGGFPKVNGPDPGGQFSYDAWIARLKLDPSAAEPKDNFDFIGLIGGFGWDAAFWVALDGKADPYVVGDSGSSTTSFPTGFGLSAYTSPGAIKPGGFDAFVVKLSFQPDGPTLTPEPSYTPWPTRTPISTATFGPSPVPSATRTPIPPATLDPATKTPWPTRELRQTSVPNVKVWLPRLVKTE